MALTESQLDTLRQFELGLDPRRPERGQIPARVLGYGEISTVLQIEAEGLRGWAFKRLPLFRTWNEVERYQAVFEDYLRLLEQEVGLGLVRHAHATLSGRGGQPVFYIVQEEVPAGCIGHRALHRLTAEQAGVLVLRILGELDKVWDYNRRQAAVQVAIDGQISNWVLAGFDPDRPGLDGISLQYLDTSTPLFRIGGVEQLDTELFLRSAPSFLVWILRLLFLKDVVDRYYDFHRVAVDLVANFYKEQRPELIPGVVSVINSHFRKAAGPGIAPLTEEEVRAYYRQDAIIWRSYLASRKVDRTIRTQLLRRWYPYILPDKVQR